MTLKQSGQTALLLADTDETQAYVFESNKLPEIRGASGLLDGLNRQIGRWIDDVDGGDCIYADGGTVLALVPAGAVAEELAAHIEASYPKQTGVATITADWRPLPAGYSDRDFGRAVSWGRRWLGRRKESKDAPLFFEVLPHQVRCQSCQKRPAVAQYLTYFPDRPICSICFHKRENKGIWFDQFTAAIRRDLTLLKRYFGSAGDMTPLAPQTLAEIGQASLGKPGYVAFLYLDGDRVGETLETIRAKEEYRAFSQKLRDAARTAVFQALARLLRPTAVQPDERPAGEANLPDGKVLIHPFEIITIGGDDVLLIVPAHAGIPIALEIGQAFAQVMNPGDVTMSAGVLLADDHTPIRILYDLSRQLLKEAKKLEGGVLDFHILKSADMLHTSVDAAHESYPYRLEGKGKGGRDLRLLARPYRYPEAGALWRELTALKQVNLPTSQMNLLAESLLDGRASSTLFYQYQRQRHGGNNPSSPYYQLEQLLKQFQRAEDVDPLPWQATANNPDYSHQTALWDVAELYDFVPGRGQEAASG
jgi:hypothetical protein